MRRRVETGSELPTNAPLHAPPTGRGARRPILRSASALIICLAGLAGALPARAVFIKAADGAGNTSPPPDDPGLAHVGVAYAWSGVYLDNGWVISANHVASNDFVLGGVTYQRVPNAKIRLTTPGVGAADLAVFKIDGQPALPPMQIASSPPAVGSRVILHGNGLNRGAPVSWGGADGWQWGIGRSLRYGTNRVAAIDQLALDTRMYLTVFDESGAQVAEDEAQAVRGDSGGAVFHERDGSWELSGIMFAVGKNAPEQPDDHVLFGNLTLIADLAVYRSEILSIIGQPTCDDGIDEDGDGLTDYPSDPGCASASDSDERDAALPCDDGIDGDGDGLVDWPNDPGCDDSLDDSEQSAGLVCDDGIDNDGDGLTDHVEDPECAGDPAGASEGPPPSVPVSSGIGTVILVSALGSLGRGRPARRQSSSSRTL